MKTIEIDVIEKVAKARKDQFIVCGNSDYQFHFNFDEHWQGEKVKTLRVIYNNEYEDIIFTGDTVNAPVLYDTVLIGVGVFGGNIKTSTPAYVDCLKSVTDENGLVRPPTKDEYAQIIDMINKGMLKGEKGDTPYIKDGNWWVGETDTGVSAQGKDGKAPVKGVDYWTEQDKSEIVQDTKNTVLPILEDEFGNKVLMSVDDNFVLSVVLQNPKGEQLSTSSVDLPIESMIINASYANGKLTLTLQNGQTLTVDISDIVKGLVSEDTFKAELAKKADKTDIIKEVGVGDTVPTGDTSYEIFINEDEEDDDGFDTLGLSVIDGKLNITYEGV